MPTEYIVPVIKAIQDEGGHYYTRQGDYIFPCSGMNTSIDVVFGGVGFTINSQDLVYVHILFRYAQERGTG